MENGNTEEAETMTAMQAARAIRKELNNDPVRLRRLDLIALQEAIRAVMNGASPKAVAECLEEAAA